MTIDRKTYKWFYDTIACRYYNLAMKYCYLPFGGEKKCRAELIAPIRFSPNERILDMCCGTGGATRAIAARASADSQIIGIDLSSGQIDAARRSARPDNVVFVQGDAGRTSFENAHFDKVFITHALHEMNHVARLQVLAEARRILKKDGEVVILEVDNPESLLIRALAGLYFFYWLPFNFETATRRDMFRRGLAGEVVAAGFRDVKKTVKFRGVFQVVTGVN